MRVIIGISGASGVIYGIRLLEVLARKKEIETHLVISEVGEQNIEYETTWKVKDVKALASFSYEINDMGAPIASGSFRRDGMVVMPCSIKTMAGLANSYNDNLLLRAGDVTTKEGRPLILVLRETPLHKGHLGSLLKLADMGVTIMPAIPAFYHKPRTVEDIIDYMVGKVLDHLNIEHNLFHRWSGFTE